jgi:Protein of unknown function (DUF2946)
MLAHRVASFRRVVWLRPARALLWALVPGWGLQCWFFATGQMNRDSAQLSQCYIVTNVASRCRQKWFCLRDARSVMTMRWLRSRSRFGSCLALFALAFQLAVSFGHVHLDHITPVSPGATALASTQASADDLNVPSSPAGREDLADDCCPICTLIHLAGALMPAETPSLALPNVFGQLRLELAAALDLTAPHAALFQARAPPIA